jgi:hypothetical protein
MFKLGHLSTVQHRIKPTHGLWLIAGNHYNATNGLHSLKGYSLNVSRVAIKPVGYAAHPIGPMMRIARPASAAIRKSSRQRRSR